MKAIIVNFMLVAVFFAATVGAKAQDAKTTTQDGTQKVVVTKSAKYHKPGATCLKSAKDTKEMTLDEAVKAKNKPCQTCFKAEKKAPVKKEAAKKDTAKAKKASPKTKTK